MIIPTLIILFIAITLIVSLLLLAGQLIRRRMLATAARENTSPHRLLDDLKPLEDALVDFFARSRVSSAILTVLAAEQHPISFKALAHEVRATEERRRTHEDIPMAAIRSVLTFLQFARLAQMSRAGFEITKLGREVYRRMQPHASLPSRRRRFASRHNASTKHRRTSSGLTPRARRVLSDLRERARTLTEINW